MSAESGARIERKIEELNDEVKLLFLMHDVCPKCHARIRRMDFGDFWRWECPKCGYIHSWNKKYFPEEKESEQRT